MPKFYLEKFFERAMHFAVQQILCYFVVYIRYKVREYQLTDWLPISKKEVELRNWTEIDVILFSGDAYIDHPAFGAAVIGRILESQGLKVAIVPQPNWRDDLRDFKKLGAPRLFFGVTSGNMDSMVNHYTANKRLRSDDAYTVGGKAGMRPDYAVKVYTNILKELYPDVPVIIGGIEASLRRVTHYDYWSDKLMPSIIAETKADLLIYGLGEKPLLEVVKYMKKGIPLSNLTNIPQTAVLLPKDKEPGGKIDTKVLFSHEECLEDKIKYAKNFRLVEEESNKWEATRLIQSVGEQKVIINPPYPPLDEKDIDFTYDLPYTRLPHPRYKGKGEIPAYEMIKWSVNAHRGCFGGCSFCTISAHQGKFVSSRSEASVLREVEKIAQMPDFKGHISDIGGPSANMYKMEGIDLDMCKHCRRPSCVFPQICPNLNTDHQPLLNLYEKAEKVPNVKKVTIGSGIRYDLFFDNGQRIAPNAEKYVEHLIAKNVSGRLKIAPEHTEREVLKKMRKPSYDYFYKFKEVFDRINAKHGLKQQLVPYFISSHPASSEKDMMNLAVKTKQDNFRLEQVQDFTPTPMTLATVIYYSGYDPYTGKMVETAKTQDEKKQQKMYFFWYKPEMREVLMNRLKKVAPNLVDFFYPRPINKSFTPHHARKKPGSEQKKGKG